MSAIFEIYEKFVSKEKQICRRIHTLDIIQSYILATVCKHGPELDTLTVEDALMAISRIHQDLLIELISVRLEKSMISHQHKRYKEMEESITSEEPE